MHVAFNLRIIPSLIFFATLLSALFPSLIQADPKSEPVTVGVLNPMTGMFAEHGVNCLKGYEFTIDELKPELKSLIKFVFEDDLSNPKGGLTAFNRLLLDKGMIATLLFSSGVALAVNPVAIEHKVPVLGLSGHSDFLSKNPTAISYWFDGSAEAKLISEYIRENKKYKRIALFTLESDFALNIRDEIRSQLQESDTALVFDEFIFNESDFKTLIAKLKASKPDILIINHTGENFPILLRQLNQQKFAGPIVTISANASPNYFKKAGAPEISNGLLLYNIDFPDSFRDKKGFDQLTLPAYAYASYLGMKLLLQALEEMRIDPAVEINREFLGKKLLSQTKIVLEDREVPVVERRIQFSLSPHVVENYELVPVVK